VAVRQLALSEFRPVNLSRRDLKTNLVEDLREEMLYPCFKVVALHSAGRDEIPRNEALDYKVDLRVELSGTSETFKLKFMDQHPIEGSRKNFSTWTKSPEVTLEIFIGYLEQGCPISLAKGKAEHISHGSSAYGTWVKLNGKGELRRRQQEYAYHLKDDNIFGGSVEKTEQGSLLVHVKAPLLPDLRPEDTVDFYSPNLGTDSHVAKTISVAHILNFRGSSTRFSFVQET